MAVDPLLGGARAGGTAATAHRRLDRHASIAITCSAQSLTDRVDSLVVGRRQVASPPRPSVACSLCKRLGPLFASWVAAGTPPSDDVIRSALYDAASLDAARPVRGV